MAFSFAAANAGAASDGGRVNQGPDLALIQTEGLGFLSLAGDTKLQLVSKWAEPPVSTASLISIASHKGLVAAAGPDAVHIATTESIRSALLAENKGDQDGDILPFTPQVAIPMPMRISQLAFTADEAFLILSAETGGGLAVYNVQALAQGSTTQSAFELSTNGATLRSLMPNPMADKTELCALVTANGDLLMADLKQQSLRNSPSGQPVLRSQVSCVAWSSRGKQIVAGCANGTVCQMTPDGQEKALIPKPPGLGDFYVASVSWLENDVFLAIYNPTETGSPSEYRLITRSAKTGPVPEYTFQKLNDPVEPFGDKAPHYTVLRLRDFPPDLQDVLLVASTAVENIGLLTRSKAPLASNAAADKITNVFTTTELADDARRAQLPMSADYSETFPIGVALDLSAKEKVLKPIPTDEIEQSPGPLPGLWVLNNEGVLLSWWVVYSESIRKGTTFPGLAAVSTGPAAAPPAASPAASQPTNAFASPKPAPAFGSPATTTPLSAAPAFGASSMGSPSRAPAFGAPAALGGPAFGSGGGLGAKPSVWGAAPKTSAFGQASFGSPAASATPAPAGNAFSAFASKPSPFSSAGVGASAGATSGDGAKSNPFSSFKSTGQSGFASLASGTTSGGSIFGSSSLASKPFGSPSATTSAFGAPSDPSAKPSLFGAPSTNKTSVFGSPSGAPKPTGASPFGSSPFVLGTTFKADVASANDNEKPAARPGSNSGSGNSLFGSGFGLSLAQAGSTPAAPAVSKDEDMDAPAPAAAAAAAPPLLPTLAEQPTANPTSRPFESTTPTTTPAPPSRFFSPLTSTAGATPSAGLFGSSTPAVAPSAGLFSRPGAFFGKPAEQPTTADKQDLKDLDATPKPSLFGKRQDQSSVPLPPDTTSKDAFPLGDSSSSSSSKSGDAVQPGTTISSSNRVTEDDAPLPQNPFKKPPTPENAGATAAKETPGAFPGLFSIPSKKSAEPPLPPDPFSKQTALKPESTESTGAPLPPVPFATSKKTETTGTADAAATTTLPSDATRPLDPFKAAAAAKAAKAKSSGSTTSAANPFSTTKPAGSVFGSSIFSSKAPASGSTPAMANPFANLPKPPPSPSTEASESGSDEGDDEGAGAEEQDDEDDEDDEGSGTDVGKDVSPRADMVKTPSYATQGGSFSSLGMDASITSNFSHIEMPRTQMFGEREAPALRPPRAQERSPRSPSPQRPSAKHPVGQAPVSGRLFREESQRSFSAPGMASQILRDTQRPAGGMTAGSGLFPGRRAARDPNLEEQRKANAQRMAEEAQAQAAQDSEEIMDQSLERSLPATLELAECVYILDSDIGGGDSVAAQAEAVYRDINRMVMVLRVNNRSMDAYLRGHSRAGSTTTREHKTEDDLDEPEGWVLCDVDDLSAIVSRDLPMKLRASRVKGGEELLEASEALGREASKLRAMHEDLARVAQVQVSADQAAAARTLPLSAEQDVQQNELRRAFKKLVSRLVEAEQQLVLLRTKLSSLAATMAAASGAAGGGMGAVGSNGMPVPTVEAVMRTIAKMTAMAEKRSGDIDVLEAQMRKLGLGSFGRPGGSMGGGGSGGGSGVGDRQSSPFSTPQKQLRSSYQQHTKRGSGLFSPSSAQRALFSSPGGSGSRGGGSSGMLQPGTPTRRKLTGYTDQDKQVLRQTRTDRQRTVERLQRIQLAEGVRHIRMD